MILTPPLLDATTPPLLVRPATMVERLLGFFDTAIVRLLAFGVVTPLLWNALGDTQFGMVVTATALASLFDWPLRAFGATVTRTLLAAMRVDDTVRLRRVALMGWLLLSTLGLALALFLTVEAAPLVAALGINADLAPDAADYVMLTGLRLAAQASMSTWQSAVLAAGLAGELTAVRGVRTLLELLVCFAVATGQVDLPTLGAMELLIVGGWGVALLLALNRAGAGWLPTLDDFDWRSARALYAHGALEATQATPFLLTFDVAVAAVALVHGVELAAVLAIAANACRLTAGTSLQLGTVVFARYRQLGVSTPRVERRWLVRRSMDAALAVVGSVTVLWGVMGTRVLSQWLEVPTPNGLGLGIAILMPFAVASVVSVRYLVTVGMDNQLGPIAAAEIVLAVILCLGLIGPWGLGGGVLAIALAHALTVGWRAPWTMCRDLRMNPLHFARGRAWRFAVAVVPALLAGLALASLRVLRSARELWTVAIICLIFQSVAAFTSWYLGAQRIGVED
jgi:hypothetical protein